MHFREVLTRRRHMVDHPWSSALTAPAAVRCVSSAVNKAKDKRRLSESSQRLKAERKCLSPLSIRPVSPLPRRHNATGVTVTRNRQNRHSHLMGSRQSHIPTSPHFFLLSSASSSLSSSGPSSISAPIDSWYRSAPQKRLEISSRVKDVFHSRA